jgi:hypothetical protein
VLGQTQASIKVTLEPSSITLTPGQKQTFTATVSGAVNRDVNWDFSGGGSSAGGSTFDLVAPTTEGTYTLKATSQADSSVTATATVQIKKDLGADEWVGVNPACDLRGKGYIKDTNIFQFSIKNSLWVDVLKPNRTQELFYLNSISNIGKYRMQLCGPVGWNSGSINSTNEITCCTTFSIKSDIDTIVIAGKYVGFIDDLKGKKYYDIREGVFENLGNMKPSLAQISGSQIKMTWNPPPKIVSYEISYIDTKNLEYNSVFMPSSQTSPYTFTPKYFPTGDTFKIALYAYVEGGYILSQFTLPVSPPIIPPVQ